MRRKHSVITFTGLIVFAILFSGLGVVLWRGGGQAFSPGPLTARNRPGIVTGGFESHADFEKECHLCHQPLKTRQAELCLVCHTGIGMQIQAENGVHGALENVLNCFDCHSDHQGRDFNSLMEAFHKFDHSKASFSLEWHQFDYETTPMECSACHEFDPDFKFLPESCTACHAGKDPSFVEQHVRDFGQECDVCHDGKDSIIGFDHQTTAFPLEGRHTAASCAACHQNGQLEGIPQDCLACHSEPVLHRRLFGVNCAECHNPSSWSPANLEGRSFDHTLQPGFSLVRHTRDYSQEEISCLGCHPGSFDSFDLIACVNCHSGEDASFMEKHINQFGNDCLDCHDGVDRYSGFDHNDFFPLGGRHGQIECAACHAEKVFQGTPVACISCHAEPEIHAGFFGLLCQYCHTDSSWTPAEIRMHPFPIDHGNQGQLDCLTCHTGVYVEYSCFGCHEHQPVEISASHTRAGISDQELLDCAACHPDGSVAKEDR